MSAGTVANRYAKSILELSIEQGKLDQINDDLIGFKEALKNRDLLLLIKSPIINADKKMSVFQSLFGNQADELTMSFFKLIMNKGRESYLPEITDSFLAQYKAHNNITSAKLITASKISAEKLNAIKASINSFTGNSTVEIIEEIDESLIGGFVIKMGDREYDASIKHKFDKLRKSFS